jgi:RNase P/RNase MRP subunit POP5
MVVKERRGRRRYVAFEVMSEELVGTEALLSSLKALAPSGTKPPKLIQFDGHMGVVRCDLPELAVTKELLVRAGARSGADIRTVSTSGTLHALRERLSLPQAERRRGRA